MRILVVDDEPVIAHTLSLIFSREGFEVAIAGTAEEALAAIDLNRPDLMLCDLDLPGRDGVELMQQLSDQQPDLPILVLTGSYSLLSRVQDCARRMPQAVSVCTKPCPPLELLETAGIMLGYGSLAS